MTDIDTLIRDLEAATEGSRELDGEIALYLGWVKHHAGWAHWTTPEGLENQHVPFFSDGLDDALTMVPDTACNHSLFSFIGHGRDDWGRGTTAWGFVFNDEAQLMGKRAAKREIARWRRDMPGFFSNKKSGPPIVEMEKAIAEHYMEFGATAPTPALAVCIAALKARNAQR